MTAVVVTEQPPDPPHWDVTGPEGAAPIVFIHGAMMGRSVWHPQIEALAGRYRCITIDQPGHGTLKELRFTLDVAVANVLEAIDCEAGGRAVVVGLSLGGYVAMTLAGRHPEKVRGLVIAGSTREPRGVSRLAFSLYSLGLRVAPEPAVRAVALAWFRRRYGPRLAAAITAGGHFAKGGSWAVKQLAGTRFKDRLLAYGGPILVINGAFDLVFRIGAGRFLAGVPQVTSRMIPWAGHLSNVDKPEQFTGLVEEFIATLPA
ncbi:MAG TPA: alpha/beta hydrolase [Candidatus Limnocylindria bacterium]|nr:alpha/beta hydrolase [Candidatus Limnocylindria bacterium]